MELVCDAPQPMVAMSPPAIWPFAASIFGSFVLHGHVVPKPATDNLAPSQVQSQTIGASIDRHVLCTPYSAQPGCKRVGACHHASSPPC